MTFTAACVVVSYLHGISIGGFVCAEVQSLVVIDDGVGVAVWACGLLVDRSMVGGTVLRVAQRARQDAHENKKRNLGEAEEKQHEYNFTGQSYNFHFLLALRMESDLLQSCKAAHDSLTLEGHGGGLSPLTTNQMVNVANL